MQQLSNISPRSAALENNKPNRNFTFTSTQRAAIALGIAISFLVAFLLVMETVRTAAEPLYADLRVAALIISARSWLLDIVMVYATSLGHWQVYLPAAFSFGLILALRRQWWWLAALAISLWSRDLLSTELKQLISRQRPDTEQALIMAAGGSFPSGHTLLAIAFYGFVAAYLTVHARELPTRIAAIASGVCIALMIGLSRIYLGVHWPSDVLGSLLLGPAMLAAILSIPLFMEGGRVRERQVPVPYWQAAACISIWLMSSIAFNVTRHFSSL